MLPLGEAPKAAKTLNLLFDIDGVQYAMAIQYMAAVSAKELKRAASSLQHRRDEIVAAIDFVLWILAGNIDYQINIEADNHMPPGGKTDIKLCGVTVCQTYRQ